MMSSDKVKAPAPGDTIRTRVVKQMESQQLTAWHLAKISGLKYDTVRRFVSGTHDTTTDKASLMLEALKVGWPDWYQEQFKNKGRKKV